MNKISILLALPILSVSLYGCQSTTEDLGAKLAESIINNSNEDGVKVEFQDLSAGKFNIQTPEGTIQVDANEDSGEFKLVDEAGKTLVEGNVNENVLNIKDEKGESILSADEDSFKLKSDSEDGATIEGKMGDERPDNVPRYLPSVDQAENFSFVNFGEVASLSFEVPTKDMKTVCDLETQLLLSKGWADNSKALQFSSDDSIMTGFKNSEKTLALTCSLDDETVVVVLQESEL